VGRDNKCKYKVSVGQSEGKILLGRHKHRWEEDILDVRERAFQCADWIQLPQERDRWRAFVNKV
jgi:hypothetical protein